MPDITSLFSCIDCSMIGEAGVETETACVFLANGQRLRSTLEDGEQYRGYEEICSCPQCAKSPDRSTLSR